MADQNLAQPVVRAEPDGQAVAAGVMMPLPMSDCTIDVGAYGAQNPLTYTFSGEPAIVAIFASGPSRQGPWTPVSGELVPPEHTFWSPDSQYLLILGHGQGLGWTPQGEALLVRWDVSKEIPPPGKGCP